MELADRLTGAIVVGCDGSTQSADAARWAVDRALDRGKRLVLLVAAGRPGDIEPELSHAGGLTAQVEKAQTDRVEAIAAELRERNPDVEVEVVAVPQRAAESLVNASKYADPLVIGTRGLGRLASHLLGAVADHVVTHGHGTIVVVPTSVWHMPGQQGGEVVVGYDYSQGAAAALDFAFAEAAEQGLSVRVVRGLELGELWSLRPIDVIGPRDPLDHHQARLERAVGPWRERYPNVPVRCIVKQGAVASVLLADESVDASLLVVGHRGGGGFAGLMLGSTARRVLHGARCPVAVVRGTQD